MTLLLGLFKLIKWMRGQPLGVAVLLLSVNAITHCTVIDPGLRRERQQAQAAASKAADERDDERASHIATKRVYREAQMAALRLEQEKAARTRAAQQEITDEALSDYRGRLAAARLAADRLRDQLATARAGLAGVATDQPMPALSDAAVGAAAPSDAGLPDDFAWRLKAQEQAIQLDALITWTIEQAKVQP